MHYIIKGVLFILSDNNINYLQNVNICFNQLKFSWENLSRENGFVSRENTSS